MGNSEIDTLDVLLSGYVSGTLPAPLHIMVDAHLELSPKSRPLVASMDHAAGDMLREFETSSVSNRDSRLQAIFDSAPQSTDSMLRDAGQQSKLPRSLRNFVGYDVDDVPWKSVMPGFKEFDLDDMDGFHVSMFWIKPGRTIPAHTHEGSEITLVLDGAFTDERGRFGRGDISVADDQINHRPTAERGAPCIGFTVNDGPLRLTGPLHQRLGDILAG
ncbi:MAG: ChrR family anti-sigma-E factor [Pseudomonadota bacterium]